MSEVSIFFSEYAVSHHRQTHIFSIFLLGMYFLPLAVYKMNMSLGFMFLTKHRASVV